LTYYFDSVKLELEYSTGLTVLKAVVGNSSLTTKSINAYDGFIISLMPNRCLHIDKQHLEVEEASKLSSNELQWIILLVAQWIERGLNSEK